MSRNLLAATFISALFAVATAVADVSYKSASTISTGAGSQDASAIAVGDINGDGRADLIVANRSGSANATNGSVVVLRGDGAGGFGAATPIHTGTLDRPIALIVLDLDGDADLDIAVVTLGNDGVLVFLNAGDGTFPAPDSLAVGNSPEAIAAGDFNGDGRPDLLVSNREDDSVTLLLNNAATPVQFSAGITGAIDVNILSQRTEPQGVAVGDFDGNSTVDAAVVLLRQDQVAILSGTGLGAFAPGFARIDVGTTATGDADPRAIVAADVDGDGDLDLAVANSVSDSVTVLLNAGDGSFTSAGDFATGNDPRGLVVADLDGDGKLDLATANFESDDVTVLAGNGDGTFKAARTFRVGSGPFGLAAGDFDGTGQLDLATANQESDNASVLLAGAANDTDTETPDDGQFADCGSLNCGPLALTPMSLTMLGIAALKHSRRTRKGR